MNLKTADQINPQPFFSSAILKNGSLVCVQTPSYLDVIIAYER